MKSGDTLRGTFDCVVAQSILAYQIREQALVLKTPHAHRIAHHASISSKPRGAPHSRKRYHAFI